MSESNNYSQMSLTVVALTSFTVTHSLTVVALTGFAVDLTHFNHSPHTHTMPMLLTVNHDLFSRDAIFRDFSDLNSIRKKIRSCDNFCWPFAKNSIKRKIQYSFLQYILFHADCFILKLFD